MVTLTKATLENKLPLVIASVIDNEVDDLTIYKSQIEKTAISFPAAFVDVEIMANTLTLRGTRTHTSFRAVIEVQANTLTTRDEKSEEIRTTLFDQESADKDSVTLEENKIRFKRYTSSIDDGYRGISPKLIRIRTIVVEGVYYGG